MFSNGFLGTKAFFYMDVSTIYFAILPFLLTYAIKFAKNGEIQKHLKTNFAIYILTTIIIIFFVINIFNFLLSSFSQIYNLNT